MIDNIMFLNIIHTPAFPKSQIIDQLHDDNMNSFYQNPFCLLGVTPRDNRQRIMEIAEEKSLTLDSDICEKARSDLTNLRARVAAEIAWLPGLSPKRITDLINILPNNPNLIRKQNLPALAKANLLGAAFDHLAPEMSIDDWVQWLLDLAYAIEDIDLEEIMRDINEDRSIATLAEIKSLDILEDEFTAHRRHYQEAVITALNRLTTFKLVDIITKAVEIATELGDQHPPLLLKDLIEGDYQSKTRKFIENEADNVQKFVDLIYKSVSNGEETVATLLDRMEQVLRKWDKIVQPIQVVMESSGSQHDISQKLAYQIRQLGVDLYNEYGMHRIATRITQILQEVFAELPEVVERLDEDSETLQSLSAKREQEERQQKWVNDLTKLLDNLKSTASRKQPINTPIDQLSIMLRQGYQLGLPDELRSASYYAIRSAGVALFNEYDLLDDAERITIMLQNAFSDIPELRKSLSEDVTAIKGIRNQREQIKRQELEWRQSITYKAEIGLVFKDILSISPSGIQWKEMSFALEQITRVRWGAISHSVNGIPTGTDYTICFGDNHRLANVVTKRQDVFQSFIDKLWRAVGVRLMTEMLEGLREGRRYQIGDALVDDHGVEVTKHRFLSKDRIRGIWSQLKVWSANGSFFIGIRSDNKAYSELSYIGTDNAHIIETAIRMKFKNNSDRLSSILNSS